MDGVWLTPAWGRSMGCMQMTKKVEV